MKVLVTARSFRHTPGAHHERLKQTSWEIVASSSDQPLNAEELVPLVSDIDGMIVGLDQVTAAVLEAAPRLRVVAKHGIGVDTIDVAAATRLGIWVTNAPGGSEQSVAELTLGLILALVRNLVEHDRLVRAGQWKRLSGFELGGKTLGLIGLGHIGREVVKRARAFGMTVIAYDVAPDAEFAQTHDVELLPLDQVLRRADIVSLHCPLTSETRELIGERALATMKPGSYLINTARGELVNETALAQAITSGHLRGAGLDVFNAEPPAGSPLLSLPQVVLSPHCGASTQEAAERVGLRAVENVIAVLEGHQPSFPVNPTLAWISTLVF